MVRIGLDGREVEERILAGKKNPARHFLPHYWFQFDASDPRQDAHKSRLMAATPAASTGVHADCPLMADGQMKDRRGKSRVSKKASARSRGGAPVDGGPLESLLRASGRQLHAPDRQSESKEAGKPSGRN